MRQAVRDLMRLRCRRTSIAAVFVGLRGGWRDGTCVASLPFAWNVSIHVQWKIYTIAPCASFFASSCRPQDGFGRVPIQIDRASESAKLKRRGIPSVSSLEGFF